MIWCWTHEQEVAGLACGHSTFV